MNKAELIETIATRLGDNKRTASEAVEAVIDTITRTVAKGEKVAITGFGIFEKVERAARTARNPATGASVSNDRHLQTASALPGMVRTSKTWVLQFLCCLLALCPDVDAGSGSRPSLL